MRKPTQEQAKQVIEHLDWESTGHLLMLNKAQVGAYWELFQPREDQVDPGMRSEPAPIRDFHGIFAAYYEHDLFLQAAAANALLHDRLLSDDHAVVLRLTLRFRTICCLNMVISDSPMVQRFLDHWRQTYEMLKKIRRRIPTDVTAELSMNLRRMIGQAFKDLGQLQEAEDAFEDAAFQARDPEDRIDCVVSLALVRLDRKKPQEALEVLQLFEEDVTQVEDEELRENWAFLVYKTRQELGAKIPLSLVEKIPREMRALARSEKSLLEEEIPADASAVSDLAKLFESELPLLEQEENYFAQHKNLLLMAQGAFSGSAGSLGEALAILQRAADLEPQIQEGSARFDRLLLQARMLDHSGSGEEALNIFESLEREAYRQESDDSLEFFGEYLLALARWSRELERIMPIVRAIYVDLELAMAEQVVASARRRTREIHQRVMEAGVLALVSALETVDQDGCGNQEQDALAWAWNLVTSTRNAELHWREGRSGDQGLDTNPALEAAFYQALRFDLVDGQPDRRSWERPLEALRDHELIRQRDRRMPAIHDTRPAADTYTIVFFQFRDLSKDRPLLILAHAQGRYSYRFLDPGNSTAERLQGWSESLYPASAEARGRGTQQALRPEGSENLSPEDLATAPRWTDLVPAEGFDWAGVDGQPWYLNVDGPLSAWPLEMLPEAPGEALRRLGEERAITLCLRPAVPAGVRNRIDFERGWLGVGAVPEAGEIDFLPGSGREIRTLVRVLRGSGPAELLQEEEARVDRLAEALQRLRPAVLHLAVHGFAVSDAPDACALILAPALDDRPEGELLTFRGIGNLALEGVELVVLSACSGATGRSDRTSTMEGLAWAFLSRGVRQVVASRYAVDDDATVVLMTEFYQALLELPVADALGRARQICLREHRIPPQEVAAWSVWC